MCEYVSVCVYALCWCTCVQLMRATETNHSQTHEPRPVLSPRADLRGAWTASTRLDAGNTMRSMPGAP